LTTQVNITNSQRYLSWLYSAWFSFIVQYRRTIIGPLWLLINPAIFIAGLGLLFSQINATAFAIFIPHLAIGFVVWTLISGFLNNSTTVYQRYQPQILQGSWSLTDIVMVDIISVLLHFLHQVPVVIVVMLIFRVSVTPYALVSIVGLAFVVVNGISLTYLFGTIGVRYRDLSQIVMSLMSILFLATPIIWMPGAGGRGGVMGAFLSYNPFFHFLELVRAPLLGNPIAPLSWIVVISFTIGGFLLAILFHKRFARNIPLWV